MRIELKRQHRFTVVGKDRVAIPFRLIGTASVPTLAVEKQHITRLARQLKFVPDLKALGWTAVTALVRAGYNSRAADSGIEAH